MHADSSDVPAPGWRVVRAVRSAIIRTLWRWSPAFRDYVFPRAIRDSGLLFIHVPKTAGTSIHTALYGRVFGHDELATWQRNYPRSMAGMPTATVVRDPVDRFLSAFYFLKKGGMNAADAAFAARHLQPYATAGELAEASASADVRRWMLGEGFHFRRQVDFLRDTTGAVQIDHLFAYERLDEAAARLSDIVGRPIRFPHLNPTARPAAVLTPRQRDLVLELYAEDVALHERALAAATRRAHS